MRSRRDRNKAKYDARGKLYGEYLADLTKTRDAIRLVVRSLAPEDPGRKLGADQAFASANVYARRYQIRITSPRPVWDAATTSLRLLREMRDLIGGGEAHHSEKYNEWKYRYDPALLNLMDLMEKDLDQIQ